MGERRVGTAVGYGSISQAGPTLTNDALSGVRWPRIPIPEGFEWLEDPTPAPPFAHNWGHEDREPCDPAWRARFRLRGQGSPLRVDLGIGTRYHKSVTLNGALQDWLRLFIRFNGHVVTQFVETKDSGWANVIRTDGWKRLHYDRVPTDLPPLYESVHVASYGDVSRADMPTWAHHAVVVIDRDDLHGAVYHAAANWFAKHGVTLRPAADAPFTGTLRTIAGGRVVGTVAPRKYQLGTEYRPADEEVAVSERDPMVVDPALIERGTRGHAATQNALAEYLRQRGIEPRSPTPDEPNYDLAWVSGDITYVAEVKSLTDRNEESQLRLGLGQVLRYRHALSQAGGHTVAVLVVEREPHDADWAEVCGELGIVLAWSGALTRIS